MFAGNNILRIVYKEILPGDYRKFEALSNDQDSGGGARDLRFSPHREFVKMFAKMYPMQVRTGVFSGYLYYNDQLGNIQNNTSYYHSPTDSRGNEGRIANVDKCISKHIIPPATAGTVIFLLIQLDDNTVWPHFTVLQTIGKDQTLSPLIKDILLKCYAQNRRANVAMCGYTDFVTGGKFCNS